MTVPDERSEAEPPAFFEEIDGPGLIGMLKLFLYEGKRDPLKIMSELKEQYGSVIRVNFPDFGGEALILSDPGAMQDVLLNKQKTFEKPDSPASRDVEEIMGNGLLTTTGDRWRRQHRILMPHFQDNAIDKMVPTVIEETDKLLSRWSSASFNHPFNLFREMKRIGLRFICRALFGYDMSNQEVKDVRGSIDTLRSAYRKRRSSLVTFPFWLPTPNNIRAKRARRVLNQFAEKLIAGRRDLNADKDDLLGTMLEACEGESDPGLSADEVRAEIVTFIIAGYTTTAAAMGWSVYELLRHPSQYERVRDEARTAVGEEDWPQLNLIPYTQAVFDETLRVYPTAPWIARSSKEEVTVGDIRVPAETPIIMTPYLLHHDPDLYDDPEAFRPSRFLLNNPPDSMRYVPFSVGAHQCIGRELALMEGPLILAKIFSEGQIQRVPETPDRMDIHTAVNIEPDRQIPVKYSLDPS